MKTKKIINAIFAFGAAIVIFGAYCKLTYKPYADIFLGIGLLTEVALFIIMGIQEFFIKEDSHNVPLHKVKGSDLSDNIDNLNKTIKQIFNR